MGIFQFSIGTLNKLIQIMILSVIFHLVHWFIASFTTHSMTTWIHKGSNLNSKAFVNWTNKEELCPHSQSSFIFYFELCACACKEWELNEKERKNWSDKTISLSVQEEWLMCHDFILNLKSMDALFKFFSTYDCNCIHIYTCDTLPNDFYLIIFFLHFYFVQNKWLPLLHYDNFLRKKCKKCHNKSFDDQVRILHSLCHLTMLCLREAWQFK